MPALQASLAIEDTWVSVTQQPRAAVADLQALEMRVDLPMRVDLALETTTTVVP